MLGFFTIVAIVIAWNAGGWWWLIAIVMGLVWGGKQEEKKKAAGTSSVPVATPVSTEMTPPMGPSVPAKSPTANSHNSVAFPCESNEWGERLTAVCSKYTASGFYVSELIPAAKLQNAQKSYPLPSNGVFLALVDTTLMGSAEDGMAIGRDGICWHNWVTEPKNGELSWHDFSMKSLSRDKTKLSIGSVVFDVIGSSTSNEKLLDLLQEIQHEYRRMKQYPKAPISPTLPSAGVSSIDINMAAYDQLLELPGIGAAEAKLILDKRVSGAHFTSLDELSEFLNLKPHKVEQLRSRVTFSSRSSPLSGAPLTPPLPQTTSPNMQEVAAPTRVSAPQSATGGRVID